MKKGSGGSGRVRLRGEREAPRDPAKGTAGLIWVLMMVAVVATVAVGAAVRGKSYIIVSLLLVMYSMVPFFASFERRKPQARELVAIAVMVALAVAARAAFIWLPNFKPMAAIVMVAGIALGPSSGFVIGAFAALASGFIFGIGPWTPWQMLSFGLCGLVFGALAKQGVIPREGWSWKQRVFVGLGGALFVLLIAGPVLDTSSVFLMLSSFTPEGVGALYIAGVPVNALQGAATFATLFLVGSPILDRLDRLRQKYGLMK